MKIVDARGLSCPEPVMLTEAALKEGGGPVKVLVTEPHQRMNVEKYAKDHGRKAVSEETEEGKERADMREKELRLVVTFHTTADAMAMEKACREQDVPGRLIPVPRSISAGCGLAWCAPLAEREKLCAVMEEQGIGPEGLHECPVRV